jgi:hypothetical protein
MLTLWTFAASIAVTILTAWVTARFALGRFYQEKSWERRVDAYVSALTALFQMRLYTENNLSVEMGAQKLTTERGAELLASWRKGHDELRRVATIGTLLLSEPAAAAIEHLVEKLDEADQSTSAFEYLDAHSAAVQNCIRAVRDSAKRDIRLR